MNIIDSIIGFFSPRSACERLYYREALRNYDGARRDRFGSWVPPMKSTPEQTDAPYRNILRGRARGLERNNDQTQSAIKNLKRNAVGSGIKMQPKTKSDKLNERILDLWQDWIKKENCDITGGCNFYKLQKMFALRVLCDGEIFGLFSLNGKGEVPLQIQLIEPDLLAEEVIRYDSGLNIVHGGVEVDDYMRPVAYHFRLDPLRWDVIRVPASEVLHSYDKSRPQQVRGISQLSSPMERISNLGEYVDSELKAARSAAAHTGVVKTAQGANQIIRSSKKSSNGDIIQEIQPGTMTYLNTNEDVIFAQPGRPNINAAAFSAFIQRSISAAMGFSYEAQSRDLSQVNYSSARQGYLEDQRTYEEWQTDLIEDFCQPVYERFIEAAVLSGALDIPDFFENRKKYTVCKWVTPGWSWIDPQKEATAGAQLLDTGLTTLEELAGSRGRDWREVLEQRKREQDYIESLGIKLNQMLEKAPQDLGEEGDDAPKKQKQHQED